MSPIGVYIKPQQVRVYPGYRSIGQSVDQNGSTFGRAKLPIMHVWFIL